MTNTRAFFATLLASVALSSMASAADMSAQGYSEGGLYVFGMGGMSLPRTIEASQDVDGTDFDHAEITLDNGYSLSAGMGYNLGNGLRVEAELGTLNFDTDEISFPDAGSEFFDDAPGTLDATYTMVSAWYSFDTGSVRPFVGAGVGMIDANMDSGPYFGDVSVDDSDTAFAWQVGGGLEMDLASNLQLVARYRYVSSSDFTVQDSGNTDVTASLDAHIIDAGIRINF
jgi:opacity protein-like surface antigen